MSNNPICFILMEASSFLFLVSRSPIKVLQN